MRRRGEALVVLASATTGSPPAKSSGPGLQQIAARCGPELVTTRDSHPAVRDVHTGPDVSPWRVKGRRRLRLALEPDLTERAVLRSHEEATDDGVMHALLAAPPHQGRGSLQHHDARVERLTLIARHVQCGAGAISELHAHAHNAAAALRQLARRSQTAPDERGWAHAIGRPLCAAVHQYTGALKGLRVR